MNVSEKHIHRNGAAYAFMIAVNELYEAPYVKDNFVSQLFQHYITYQCHHTSRGQILSCLLLLWCMFLTYPPTVTKIFSPQPRLLLKPNSLKHQQHPKRISIHPYLTPLAQREYQWRLSRFFSQLLYSVGHTRIFYKHMRVLSKEEMTERLLTANHAFADYIVERNWFDSAMRWLYEPTNVRTSAVVISIAWIIKIYLTQVLLDLLQVIKSPLLKLPRISA